MTIAIPAWILWVFYAIGITSLIVFACVGIYQKMGLKPRPCRTAFVNYDILMPNKSA